MLLFTFVIFTGNKLGPVRFVNINMAVLVTTLAYLCLGKGLICA